MPPVLRHRNGTLFLDNTVLQEGAIQETYLTADTVAASSSTLSVKSINGFAINQIILIEELGTENAEIVKTHASSAPSGTTVTLTAAVARAHPAGSKVYVIKFDQFELSRSATAAGVKTVLTAASGIVSVQPDVKVQRYKETEFTSGYYFARYKDSIAATYGDYSGALPYGGFDKTTVGYVIEQSLHELGLTLSDRLSRADCYAYLTEMFREVEGKQLRWPEHYNFNYPLTTITAGDYQYPMPTDAYDTESNRSVVGARVGSSGRSLGYLDPIDFEEAQDGLVETTSAEAGSVGETAIDLTSAADFASAGTVTFYVSGVQYSFTYTSKSTNTLNGIPASGTGSITQAFASGDTMYQNASFGTPTSFTVREGSLDFTPIPDADTHGKSIYLDYAMVCTAVDSDDDTIDLHRYDMALPYLTWRIKMKVNNNNNLNLKDGYYAQYKEKLNDAIRTSPRGLGFRMKPRINTMRKR